MKGYANELLKFLRKVNVRTAVEGCVIGFPEVQEGSVGETGRRLSLGGRFTGLPSLFIYTVRPTFTVLAGRFIKFLYTYPHTHTRAHTYIY